MKRREANLRHTDENIAEQYTNLSEGLQKDAGQNSWDARATKKGKDWKLVFKCVPELNSLIVEDFGTVGMNAKRWKEYQSLWDTTKAEETKLGARGQGKFLFHYFSKDKLVLTESIDEEGTYRFSFGTSEEYDDETKKLGDFIPGTKTLDHQGTRIWIMNLKEDLKNELLDFKACMNYMAFSDLIAATWWEIIRNWDATFIINFDGMEHKVGLPKLPDFAKEKEFINEKISDLGKVGKLVLRYCNSEMPALFRGVAVQRGGMTILRIPVSAEESIKNRIYGYCIFDEDLEMELKKLELPNHFGFRSKRAWNHTHEYIRRKLEEFIQEISPVKRKEIPLPKDLVDRAVRIVNDLVREHMPELATAASGSGGKKGETEKHRKSEPPPSIRIDTFWGNARRFEYDESLITECELVNETNSEVDTFLQIEVTHEKGTLKFNPKYAIRLKDNGRKRIDIPLIDFQEGTDEPGEYTATASLQDGGGQEFHKRTFTFYLHKEPPPPRGKVFLSTITLTNGKGTPLEKKKHLPITEKGLLRIIWDHPDFIHTREVAGSKKALKYEVFLYLIKCGVDEAIQKLLEFKYEEGQLNGEEIREIKNKNDRMYYDAVLTPKT